MVSVLLSPIEKCWGDLNADGVIGPADLANLLASWGTCTAIAGESEAGAPEPGPNEPAWIEEVKLWLNGIGQSSLATELHQKYYGQ